MRVGFCILPCPVEMAGAWERTQWQGDGLILPRHMAQLPPQCCGVSKAGGTSALRDPSVLPGCLSLQHGIPVALCPDVSPWQGHMQEHPWPNILSPTCSGFSEPLAPTTLPVPCMGCMPPGTAWTVHLFRPHPGAGLQSHCLTPGILKDITLVCGYFSPLAGLVCRMLCGLSLQLRIIN